MKNRVQKNLMIVIVVVLAVALAACGGNSAPAQSEQGASSSANTSAGSGSSGQKGNGEPEISVRVAFGPGKGSLPYDTVVIFKEKVEERSNGRIEIKMFPDSQLGSDSAVLDALKLGTIEMTLLSTALASKVPEFGVFDIPFLFADRSKVERIAHGEVWEQDLKGKLPAQGLVGLGFWEAGFRQITNNVRPINEPADLKGLKIRVPESQVRMAMFSHFGANPVPMDFGELFSGLHQGVVDGQEGPLSNTQSAKLDEVQKYLSITNHNYSPAYLLASKKWFDTLSPEDQQLLTDAAQEAGDEIRDRAENLDKELIEYFKEKGMEVNTANIVAFQAEIGPVTDLVKEQIDPAFVDKVIEHAK